MGSRTTRANGGAAEAMPLAFRARNKYLRQLCSVSVALPPDSARGGHDYQALDFGPCTSGEVAPAGSASSGQVHPLDGKEARAWQM